MRTSATIVIALSIGTILSGCQPVKVASNEVTSSTTVTQTATKPPATTSPITKSPITVPPTTAPPATKPPATTSPETKASTSTQINFEWARDLFEKNYGKAFYVESDKALKRIIIYPRDEDELEFIMSEYLTDSEARDTWDTIRESLIEVSATLGEALPGYTIVFGNTLNRNRSLLEVVDGEVKYDFADEKVAEEPESSDEIDMVEFAHVVGLKKGLESAYEMTFDFKRREMYLNPTLSGIETIITLKDSSLSYKEKWDEIVDSIVDLSNEMKENLPRFKYVMLNPKSLDQVELIVQDGVVVYDSSDNE